MDMMYLSVKSVCRWQSGVFQLVSNERCCLWLAECFDYYYYQNLHSSPLCFIFSSQSSRLSRTRMCSPRENISDGVLYVLISVYMQQKPKLFHKYCLKQGANEKRGLPSGAERRRQQERNVGKGEKEGGSQLSSCLSAN